MFSNGFWEVWTLCDDVMIDDERVGGSRLWLPSAGAAAGVLQVTGAPGTLISLKRLQLRGEVLHEGPLRSIRGDTSSAGTQFRSFERTQSSAK